MFVTSDWLLHISLSDIGSWTWAKYQLQTVGKHGTEVCTKHRKSTKDGWWVSTGENICTTFLSDVLTGIFPFGALTLLVGWQEGNPACKITRCWFVDGDILTGALHVLLQLSPSPSSSLAPTKARMETFWYQLTQVHLEKWPLKWREKILYGIYI